MNGKDTQDDRQIQFSFVQDVFCIRIDLLECLYAQPMSSLFNLEVYLLKINVYSEFVCWCAVQSRPHNVHVLCMCMSTSVDLGMYKNASTYILRCYAGIQQNAK